MTHSTSQSPSRSQHSLHYRGPQPTHIQFGDFAPRRAPSRGAQVPYPRQYRPVHSPPMANVSQAAYGPPPVSSVRRQPRVRRRVARRSPRSYLLAGGSMLALAALVVGPKPMMNRSVDSATDRVVCQETVQAKSVLSRAELSELLAISERAPKADVQAVIEEPYCTLPPVEVREGVTAQRVAYPLEFNPETWFVVLYEGDEYAGFDFSFSRN
ncbi:MAG: hypothetical protein AAGG53_12195 [Cyanobacteria bacterium P01_H01_bin.152]